LSIIIVRYGTHANKLLERTFEMDYCSVSDIAKKWNMTPARVSNLCLNGRINGAVKEGRSWRIPVEAVKPNLRKKRVSKAKFRFIDLFAGIGGFHQAMRYLGGECVMAAEINQACVETYKANFKTLEGCVRGDVRKIDPQTIEEFDVLCAGFPCQPFSKAGLQKGFNDETRGNLFYSILNILDQHQECKFIVLENVRNLADKTENWEIIRDELLKRDFIITRTPLILSPSDFGIPQVRERVYILGIRKDYCRKEIEKKDCIDISDLQIDKYFKKCKIGAIKAVLERNVSDHYLISEERELMIEAWNDFRIKTNIQVIGFPIWISCFGLGIDDDSVFKTQIGYYTMPEWKQKYVDKNRTLYLDNRDYIDKWIQRYDMLSRIKLYQKFEWNCGTDVSDIHDAVIQVRQSGIRVKRSDFFPSLVAMVNTPIIWDLQKSAYRYITPREAANLQNFIQRYKFIGPDQQIYRQLGNSVNVRILKILCRSLFDLRNRGCDSE